MATTYKEMEVFTHIGYFVAIFICVDDFFQPQNNKKTPHYTVCVSKRCVFLCVGLVSPVCFAASHPGAAGIQPVTLNKNKWSHMTLSPPLNPRTPPPPKFLCDLYSFPSLRGVNFCRSLLLSCYHGPI